MYADIARLLTDSIDVITRNWVDDLRHTARTDIHKQLLSAEIVGGIKGMLQNLAEAIATAESPDGENLPVPVLVGENATVTSPKLASIRTTRPLGGPLDQARLAAANIGSARHRQGYEIQEVLYEFVKLRQEIWKALRDSESLPRRQSVTVDIVAYVDR